MAIAGDNAADLGNAGGSGGISTNFTVGAGSSRLLLVPIAGDSVGGGSDDITSVKFNGVDMSLLTKITNASGQDRMLYWYGLLSPTVGTHLVDIVCASAHQLYALGRSYTGVKQSGLPDAFISNVEADPNDLTLTTAITTAADNCWLVTAEGGYDGSAHALPGSGATLVTFDGVDGALNLFDSNGPVTPAGSHSMTTNRTSNPFNLAITHLMISIAPDVVGSAPFPPFARRSGQARALRM